MDWIRRGGIFTNELGDDYEGALYMGKVEVERVDD